MACFERIDAKTFLPTQHTGGAWNPNELHIAPVVGLLTHALEIDYGRRGNGFVIGRMSYDILGTIPVELIETDVQIVRLGRTVELVEASIIHNHRPALRMRAWLMKPNDTRSLNGTPFPRILPPDKMPHWNPSTLWPGGFIASLEVRRVQQNPGRAAYWARVNQPLRDNEPISQLARAAAMFDIPNGMTVRTDPRRTTFPNVDITVHLFGAPTSDWLGFDTSVSFGSNGLGLTSSILHDEAGPIGTIAQTLTVRT
ncbi:MAG: thioesterase family protein [Nevskia sp.]|nr:thioesterase family protein [Nevskia sp.]